MNTELLKTLAEKKVTSCDTTTLGWMIGHLYDHQMTRKEIESLVGSILDGIERMKADPSLHEASRLLEESAKKAAGKS